MKVVGIIAEYNPFHNGHAYQIQKIKQLTHADYIVVVMSGNYVQRGAPAIMHKFHRASMALHNGADLVFELPVIWSTSSAESFAMAGISLLDHLGIADFVSFGCETDDISLFLKTAEILKNEPKEFSELLQEQLKQGINFPSAREKALLSLMSDTTDSHTLHQLLSSPNNILGIEYCKALYKRNSNIKPLPILRKGAGYHDTALNQNFSSASSLRHLLSLEENPVKKWKDLEKNVPKDVFSSITQPDFTALWEWDFSSILYYKLFSEKNTGFADYLDGSVFLSNRICNLLDSYLDFEQFALLVKTKDVTLTRIRRLLLHILLDIKYEDYSSFQTMDYLPWLRLLGFRREASFLLKRIQENTSIPIITKPAKAKDVLTKAQLPLFQKDTDAANLYYGVLSQKTRLPQKNEFQRQCLIF